MRRLGAVVAILVSCVVGFFGVVVAASESGEVITLHTRGADAGLHATRLWVVDHEGAEWSRTGHPEKGWFVRLLADPIVELERGDTRSARRAVPVSDPVVARDVNRAFSEKYGAADWIVALSGDASHRVVIRLDDAMP